MPKRDDIHSVLVIGSGPIVIGQACEFDYSGTQACRVLREEGIRVVLVNSNPATIMTDPEFADATYVEPITPEFVEQVIAKERPDALLATLGGQTALNCAMSLAAAGVLERYGVELIGASIEAIEKGENRESFKRIVEGLPAEWGAEVAASRICHTMDDCLASAEELGYPVVVRPSFTMGGAGSGLAYDEEDLHRIAGLGLSLSPTTEVLLEESILGWKEYELEVMRDRKDNVVIVCSIENIDPMGVHTGDSITVAPALTLTDREYQRLRDISIGVIREVGVDTGGCNIQFAVNPVDGRVVVIEMNPRVSRSSALASKATGFPIAKIAAKVAIGYTLDEIPNDITTRPDGQSTPASFEPTLDYVVVKVPRFAFEKFPHADPTLTTHMKSVGEAMAIGRNFTEALQKALRSLESPNAVFDWHQEYVELDKDALLETIRVPTDGRLKLVMDAIRAGATPEEIFEATAIDPWFVDQLALINEVAAAVTAAPELTPDLLRLAKRHGFSDAQLGKIRGMSADVVRGVRHALGIRPVYKTVDTCAAEFAAATPYHYSTYDEETEVEPRETPAVIILGSGPNRIGQGIEFDYSCVHASMALGQGEGGAGFETIMVNCNPETVSTDYDTSDRLYFEPLTLEDVLEVVHAEQQAGPVAGVICQLGGQTPLGLAQGLEDAGVPIVGTTPEAIHLAEERGAFGRVLHEAGLTAPMHGMASSYDEAAGIAKEIGYPVLVRPSYVLGGRGMEIVYDDGALEGYIARATAISPEHPVLVDRFIDDAVEIDVDAIFDGEELFLGGVMEHIEEAGIHSGDSSCALPPITLGDREIDRIRAGDRGDRPRRRRARADQHPVRARLRRALRPRGQPARQPDRAVRLEGDRDAAGQGRGPGDAGRLDQAAARRGAAAGLRRRRQPAGRLADRGEGGGDAVQPVPPARRPLRRHRARPGDEVDRRGDGLRRRLRPGVRQGPGRGVRPAAHLGQGVRLDGQPRQADHDLPDQGALRPRLRDPRHPGHRRRPATQRRALDRRTQALRRPRPERRADHRAADRRRRRRPGREHAPRLVGQRGIGPGRRLRDPHRRGPRQRPLHHHRPGARCGRAGHRGPDQGRHRRAFAAGLGPAVTWR